MKSKVVELEALVKSLEEQVSFKDKQLEELKERLFLIQADLEASQESMQKELEENKMKTAQCNN